VMVWSKITTDFVVLDKAPAYIAARLRISEKDFVVDYAQLFADQPWFKRLSPQDWCSNVALLSSRTKVVRLRTAAGPPLSWRKGLGTQWSTYIFHQRSRHALER